MNGFEFEASRALKKAIINFKYSYIRIHHFITISMIYGLLEFYRKYALTKDFPEGTPKV